VRDAGRAADIIDRIRSLYKRASPERRLVSIDEIIADLITLLDDEAKQHSVVIRTEFAESLPRIMADSVQVQQVLMNLMLNAIQAMKDAGGELVIKSQQTDDGKMLISVSDSGLGLPAEKADQIFDPFFTTKSEGSGMGLAISRSIVESHGGRLWASTNTVRGATFYFTLPIQTTAAPINKM
jgi:signal transduction histidine kinase